jgi:hypothetical protein
LREVKKRYDGHERVQLLHRGPPTQHPLDEYENTLHVYRPGTNTHVVCDRWHLGELVYPHLLGRETRYDTAVHRHVDLFLRSRGALIVYLEPERAEVARRIHPSQRGRMPDAIETMTLARWGEVIDRYQRALVMSGLDRARTTDVAYILELAEALEGLASPLSKFTTYVGPPRPNILLLGDTRGVKGKLASGPAPAFAPYRGTSGHYLLSYLDVHPQGSLIGLANACDADDPDALWKTLGEPSVVALGAVAHNRLTELDVPHGAVPHPQYVRRFYHGTGHIYAQVIMRAAHDQEDLSRWRP